MISSASSTTQSSYGFDAQNRLTATVTAPPATRPTAGFNCVDQNNSSTVNSTDLLAVSQSFGHTPGRANFALRDVDTNGVVEQADQDRLAAKFNQSCPTTAYRYVYDGNGRLLKRTLEPNAASTSTIYIGGVYEKQNDGTVRKYYPALGRMIAVREVPPAGGAGTLRYLLSDHLGGTVEVLDAAGATLSETKYWPYGATRTGGVTQTDKLYTAQQQEAGDSPLGLYNYKARFYSTTLGRFLSADPIESSNRYAYVANNPLRFVDPSGLALGLLCGWTQTCSDGSGGTSGGGSIEQWRSVVIEYWESNASRVHFWGLDRNDVFDMFAAALGMNDKFSNLELMETFDVMAFDASYDAHRTDPWNAAHEFETAADFYAEAGFELNYFAGFSFGAMTLYQYLWNERNSDLDVRGVYLYGGPDEFILSVRFDKPNPYFDISSEYGAYVIARSGRFKVPGASVGGDCVRWLPCFPEVQLTPTFHQWYPEVTGGARLRPYAECGHCVDENLSRGDANELFKN